MPSASESSTRLRHALATPAPVREFILKVASRCNLDCDYCYEYRHGDDSWKLASKLMAANVCEQVADRIAEHANKHSLDEVSVAFHGGEPLMLGPARFDQLAKILRQRTAGPTLMLSLSVQTNASLLTDENIDVLRRHDVRVGVSLDGARVANDRHRRDHRGRSSYERVIAGLERLQQRAPELACGLLAVIDTRNDPIETLDSLVATGIESIDFLLPHHNWDRPPPRGVGEDAATTGLWLSTIWDAWIAGRHDHVRIRFLDNIVARLVGHEGLYEQMSIAPVQLITISTDGEYEGVDTLKSTASGLQRTGLNVFENEVDEVLTQSIYQLRQDWQTSLPSACRSCDINQICTGGYLPHRFSTERGFDNPSVYCADIKLLVERVRCTIAGPHAP